MGKKKKVYSFVEQMLLLHKAGLTHKKSATNIEDFDDLDDLSIRIKKILEISNRNHLNSAKMLYFIMYDIENNKVRTLISKYLIRQGCQRVQKSIFFAESDRLVYNNIKKDLLEVQESYENNDSIFLVPVSTDQLRAMKVIGQNIDFDIVLENKNTLFF
jgi:CRISPR-associated protein Cas2